MKRSLCLSVVSLALLLVLAPGASAADQLWWSSYYSPSGVSVVDLGGTAVTQPFGSFGAYGTTADMANGRIIYVDYDADRIVSVRPDGSDRQVLASTSSGVPAIAGGLDKIYGVAFDTKRQRIYWGDDATKSIYWASTVDPNAGGLLRQNDSSGNLESPAYDAVSDRVYWVNDSAAKVEYANPDGTGFTRITLSGMCTADTNLLFSVAVDAADGKLYVFGSANRLQRANLDGSGCEDLAGTITPGIPTSNGNYVAGLALDKGANRLYWGDYWGDAVGYTNLATNTETTPAWTGAAINGPAYPMLTKAPAAASKAVTPATAKTGATLTCDVVWSPGVVGAFEYRSPQGAPSTAWARNGAAIAGATGTTLVAHKPGSYTCSQTASNFAGSKTETAAAATVISRLVFVKGASSLRTSLNGAGRLAVKVTAKSGKKTVVVATGSAKAKASGRLKIKLRLSKAGKALLKKAGRKGVSGTVTVTETLTGGKATKKVLGKIRLSGR
ncbi:unannotated protein [freshwater metagenome]|uniref:Unannotated protein n=1 Tax=freshwater metagenome TaxID=449393 RepID=A0A6J7DG08_9ZZZZ|nr:hypothetical protein [Actinomycetota bacterium]